MPRFPRKNPNLVKGVAGTDHFRGVDEIVDPEKVKAYRAALERPQPPRHPTGGKINEDWANKRLTDQERINRMWNENPPTMYEPSDVDKFDFETEQYVAALSSDKLDLITDKTVNIDPGTPIRTRQDVPAANTMQTVSYTHLTLPTKRIV